jgi:hypothetical protein
MEIKKRLFLPGIRKRCRCGRMRNPCGNGKIKYFNSDDVSLKLPT